MNANTDIKEKDANYWKEMYTRQCIIHHYMIKEFQEKHWEHLQTFRSYSVEIMNARNEIERCFDNIKYYLHLVKEMDNVIFRMRKKLNDNGLELDYEGDEEAK